MDIERLELFSIPVWRSRIPEMDAHNAELDEWIEYEWQQGSFRRGAYGYGYQSPDNLFVPAVLDGSPALQTLKRAFQQRVMAVLKQRVNQSVKLPPEAYAFAAWALVQTNEEWTNGPWHDHFPAVVSGCYYLRVPATASEGEGALAFMRPGAPDAFSNLMDYVKPQQGDFMMFPSNLLHRPVPCPSATGLRVSINMDCYIHWAHWNEDGKPAPDPKAWLERVRNSLNPTSPRGTTR